jgi:Uncharacterised nucleotidyltransferase
MVLTTCLRPEDELLLCCARTSIDANRAAQIQALLREDLDWAHLIEIASMNGMTPLLYRSLSAICPEAVPGASMEQLRDQFEANTRYNLYLTAELLKLLDLLETHGIPALPFKGPVLAASVYSDLSLRQFDDLDILVHEPNVLIAKDLLIAQGYRTQPGGCQFHLSNAQEQAYLRSGCDYAFVSDDSEITVEVHWRFTRRYFPFLLDLARLWERLEPVSLGGKMVPSVSPEDLILILCVHGSKHLWERLSWICDVAELIRTRPDMNWGRVMEQARTTGSERMLLLGMCLAHELLDAVLPPHVMHRVQADPVVHTLATKVCRWLFYAADDPSGVWPYEWPYIQLFHLRMRERLSDRICYCLRWALTPTVAEWDYLRLPTWLAFVYYLLRPIRVVKQSGQGVLKRALRP